MNAACVHAHVDGSVVTGKSLQKVGNKDRFHEAVTATFYLKCHLMKCSYTSFLKFYFLIE